MKRLVMTKGLPASGKTTWAKALIAKEPGCWKRINKDDLREMLDDSKWSPDNEKFILKIRDTIVTEALNSGKHVIVDDTNLHLKHEQRLGELAKQAGAKFEIQDFTDVSVDTCIKRDLLRHKSVGEKVIRDHYKQYLQPKPEVVKHDPSLPNAIICDIDGTLAIMGDRGPYDWDKVGVDTVNEPVRSLLNNYEQSEKGSVILLSGRDGSCATETRSWLLSNGIWFDALHMRSAGDMRKDYVVKEEMYNEHVKGKYNVSFVLDDRNQVVELWRRLGLACFQVAEGDF